MALRNLIVLPNGTEIFSGAGTSDNIRSASFKESVNTGTELSPGSVFASILDVQIQTPGRTLEIGAGTEVEYYKVDESGNRTKIGLFTLEKPTWSKAHIYRFTAYDRISRLDKDLTSWLASLEGWPYTLSTFARMICEQCGLTLATTSFPNGDFPVKKFPANEATGRKIMGWIGQLAARFVRANANGEIELAWYTPSGVTIRHSGDRYYFAGSLSYEDYQVACIEAVQLRIADSEYDMLWPEVAAGANSYVISGNKLITEISEDILPYLETIRDELARVRYTPCSVAIPACLDVRAGQTVEIVDANGVSITTYVMTKTQRGQKDTLECTGSPRRDSSSAQYDSSDKTLQDYADNAAASAVKRQTQMDIFNKLTNNGQAHGLFIEKDGQVYINATYISTGILASKDGETFYLDLDNGILKMKIIDEAVNDLQQQIDDNVEMVTKKHMELEVTVDGLVARVEDVQLQIDNDVETITRKFMELETNADGLASTVSKQTESIDGIKDEMTQVQQKSDEIAFIVKNISDNGVDHLETTTGVYVRDDGVHVEREGDEVNSHLAHDGLRVNALDDARLIADVNGVDAYNLKAHNYLTIGHARFEAYGSDQTACFYV